MLLKLKILKGASVGKEIPVNAGQCVIGRSDECHLRPQSDAVSRRHCVIVLNENEALIRDLNSRNGTYVNDQRIAEETVLLAGDIIRVGPLEFEIIFDQAKKRPKVTDMKDVLARTAEGSSMSTTANLGNVSDWLDAADKDAVVKRASTPDTKQFRVDETSSGVVAATSTPESEKSAEAVKADKDAKKKPQPMKLPPKGVSTNNSRDAAGEALKRLFKR